MSEDKRKEDGGKEDGGKEDSGKERRRSPRVKATHDVVLNQQDGDEADAIPFSAKSVDLNLGGIYCTLGRYVPLFSKMSITLNLPVSNNDDSTTHVYECGLEGVVVRIEPEEPDDSVDEYHCALAFVNTDEEVELLLAKYLLQTMVRTGDVN
ncbi:MAG: c-di-GMP-binding flagellar brake protein YcgR [Myxococcota bacterium]|jgi:c-di-GMP-binding flagellar brake protein YcgR